MTDLNLEGMAVAEGVVDTIVAIALQNVEGARLVGASAQGGPRGLLSARPGSQGIEVRPAPGNKLAVAIHLDADYGHVLPELAAAARQAVSDAVLVQVGVEVSAVDVYIDSIQF